MLSRFGLSNNVTFIFFPQSILADFNHEQASFLASLTKNSAGALPWTGCENPEEMKQQILSLSEDKRTFVRNPPNGMLFNPINMLLLFRLRLLY